MKSEVEEGTVILKSKFCDVSPAREATNCWYESAVVNVFHPEPELEENSCLNMFVPAELPNAHGVSSKCQRATELTSGCITTLLK